MTHVISLINIANVANGQTAVKPTYAPTCYTLDIEIMPYCVLKRHQAWRRQGATVKPCQKTNPYYYVIWSTHINELILISGTPYPYRRPNYILKPRSAHPKGDSARCAFGLPGTMTDLLVDIVGAILAAFTGYKYVKEEDFLLADDVILYFLQENPQLVGNLTAPTPDRSIV